MFELNAKIQIRVESFRDSTIYYMDDFYQDPNQIVSFINNTECSYHKQGELNSYNGIHFDDKLIQVNGSIEDHDGRYSFTVAHELGHHCLHKDEFKKQTSGDEIMCRETGEKPIAELQADRFAAYLLMPSKMVLSAFNKAFGGDSESFDMGYKNKYKLGAIAGSVIDVGGFSNVSITAMTNRLIGMNLITGVNYQSRVIPEIEIRSLKGLWKYYVSTFNKEVKRIKRYMK